MMFTSDQNKIDPETVEEFQWQGLEAQHQGPPASSMEFQLWDYNLPEGTPREKLGAETKVEDILAVAHLKAEQIEQQAYEDGFQQGQKDGQEVGRRALEEVVKRLQSLVTTLEQDREGLFQQREGILLDLVLLVSEKLVSRELSLHPEAIRQIIEEGFRQVAHQEGLRLMVSPLDYEVLQQENLDSWPSGVELQADATISPGGFRLESSLGEVDGTRETRWSLIVQAVHQALETVNAPDTH